MFINILKYQPAGYGGSFGQPRPDNVAKHKGPPAAGAEKFKTAVAQLIIVVRQRTHRNQPLGTQTFHRGKDARRSQSGNFDVKITAKRRLHIGGKKSGVGFAFGTDSLSLGCGNVLAYLFKKTAVGIIFKTAAVRHVVCLDEGAVNQQIGIAAYRRRKMRIVGKPETEMAEMLGAVTSLSLQP